MPGEPLSLLEREEISRQLTLNPNVSWVEIARALERHPTTISREVIRNGGRARYRPAVADRAAVAARCRTRPRLAHLCDTLREQIRDELGAGRSPEAIWADLAAEGIEDRPCVETIYQAIYHGTLNVKASECLRTRRPRRRSRQARHTSKRPAVPTIALRPVAVNDRTEPGHCEADQIIGARNRSSMLWLSERVTRMSIPVTTPNGYSSDAMLAGLIEGLDKIPAHLLKSVTFDQGSEWACWPTIAEHYEIDCWFCDPHSPWQRGQIENLNRQWRFWFPRGTRLDLVTPAQAQAAADVINNQRRRSFGYESPAQRYHALTVH